MKIQKKQFRHRYFSVQINADKEGTEIYRLCPSISSLSELLKKSEFPTQKRLEKTLDNLVIQEQHPKIVIIDFKGQLQEGKKKNPPYWKISCQTSSATTAISLARALSQQLFCQNSVDSRIKVQSRERLEELDSNLQLHISNSDWSPGYLDSQLCEFLKLMENFHWKEEIVLESLQNHPKVETTLVHLGKIIAATKETSEKPKQPTAELESVRK